MATGRILILSDGKPGHVNQSIAFSRHLGCDYDLCRVAYPNRLAKAVSYLLDRFSWHWRGLFSAEDISGPYAAVVSAGSTTYYPNRVLAAELGARSVAIMLPRGYRYDFDLILAQEHDEPPPRDNILPLPVNLSYVEPAGLVRQTGERKPISLVIGGDSQHGRLDPQRLRSQLERIYALFPGREVWLTTSRRTSPQIEALLDEFRFSYAVFYSRQPVNPIADFLLESEYVFLTADSSSMISEAVSVGQACVEILPPVGGLPAGSKLTSFITGLERQGCLHLFDGSCGGRRNKISLDAVFAAPIVQRLIDEFHEDPASHRRP